MKKCQNCFKKLKSNQKRNKFCSSSCSAKYSHKKGVFKESQKLISKKNLVYTEEKIKSIIDSEKFIRKSDIKKFNRTLY